MLYCFLKVPDWSEELVQRQNIYMEVLRLAKSMDVMCLDLRFSGLSTRDAKNGARIAKNSGFMNI